MRFALLWTAILSMAMWSTGCGNSSNNNPDASTSLDQAVPDQAVPVPPDMTQPDMTQPRDSSTTNTDASRVLKALQMNGSGLTPVKVAGRAFYVGITRDDNRLVTYNDSTAGGDTIGPNPLPDPANDTAIVKEDVVFLWTNIDPQTHLADLTIWRSGTTLTPTEPIHNAVYGLAVANEGGTRKIVFAVDQQAIPDGTKATLRLCNAGGAGSLTATCGHAVNQTAINLPTHLGTDAGTENTCTPQIVYAGAYPGTSIIVASCVSGIADVGSILSFADTETGPIAGTTLATSAAVRTTAHVFDLSPLKTKLSYLDTQLSPHVWVTKVGGAPLDLTNLGASSTLTSLCFYEDGSGLVMAIYRDATSSSLKSMTTDRMPPIVSTIVNGVSSFSSSGYSSDAPQIFMYFDTDGKLSYTRMNGGGAICSGNTCTLFATNPFTYPVGGTAIYKDGATAKSITFSQGGSTEAVLGSDPHDFFATVNNYGIYADNYDASNMVTDIYKIDASNGTKNLIRAGIDTYFADTYGYPLVFLSPDRSKVVFMVHDAASDTHNLYFSNAH